MAKFKISEDEFERYKEGSNKNPGMTTFKISKEEFEKYKAPPIRKAKDTQIHTVNKAADTDIPKASTKQQTGGLSAYEAAVKTAYANESGNYNPQTGINEGWGEVTPGSKPISSAAGLIYKKIVNPLAEKAYGLYEKLDDYAVNENDLNRIKAAADAQGEGQAVNDESLRLNRILNERKNLLSGMTDEQKNIYDSLPEWQRKDYLDSIEDELNQKAGLKEAEYISGEGRGTASPAGYAFAAGVNNFGSGLKGAVNLLRGKEGETAAKAPIEYTYGAIAPSLKGGEKVLSDIAYTTGNMAPSMAVGLLSGGLGTAAMGISSAGNSYDEAIREGYTPEKAAAYGISSGIKEAALQRVAGALPGVSNAQSVLTKALGKYGHKAAEAVIKNDALRTSLEKIAGSALSEGSEEYVQELLDPILKNIFLGEDNEVKAFTPEALYAGALGAISGGMFEVPGAIKTGVEVRGTNVENGTEGSTETAENVVTNNNETEIVKRDMSNADEQNNYRSQIKKMMLGKMSPAEIIRVGTTPEILQHYGAKNHNITLKQSTVRKIVYPAGYMGGNHNLGFYFLDSIPNQLNNPVAILKSKTQADSLVIITEFLDAQNNPVQIALHLDKQGNLGIANEIASAYGKRGFKNYIELNRKEGNVLYENQEKGLDELPGIGLQLPKLEAKSSDPINSIDLKSSTVNREYMPEAENDTINLGKNIINETEAESRLNTDTAEAEVKETKEKRIMRSKALRAVNPNSPDAQNIYRGIMRNYGYGDMVSKMDAIAKKLGSEVQFYADNTKSDGYNENNVIHLNVNNLRSTADGVWKVFKHELTHSLEGTNAYGELLRSKTGAELFNEFLKKGGYTVTDAEGNTTTSVEVLKNEIRKLYAKNNVELSAEQLNHECIAKFIEQSDILTSEESIQRLAEGNPNFALRIYNWIKDTIAKFGASPETKMLMEAERLYAKALRQAAKGEYQYAKTNSNKTFDFKNDNEGKRYWNIETEQDIFKNLKTTSELKKAAYDYILNGEKGQKVTEIIDGKPLEFTRIGAKEYVYGKQGQKLAQSDYNKKMRIVPSVLDLIENADTQYHTKDMKSHKIASEGWENYRGRVRLDDVIFDYVVRVGTSDRQNTFYDINLEVERKVPVSLKAESLIKSSTSNNSIYNGDKNINKKFSFKEEDTLTGKETSYLHRATNNLLNDFLEITGADGFTDKNSLKADINSFAQESAANGKTDRAEGEKIFDLLYNGAENNRKAYADAKNEFMASLNRFEQGINDVIRYTRSKEAAADQRAGVKAERADKANTILTDKAYAKQFYKDFKQAKRAYDKLADKEMLTAEDTSIMRQLSNGTVTMDEVEKRANEFNVDAIKRVYDAFKAKTEFEKVQGQLRKSAVGRNRELAKERIANSDSWQDKKAGALYKREIMERNIEDITKGANGKNRRNDDAVNINKTYFKPIHENEAKSNRLKNELVERVKSLKLGTKGMYTVMIENDITGMPMQEKVSESGLVQLYGEGIIDDATLDSLNVDKEKIHNAVKEFRDIYNQLLDMANETLIRNGYEPVEYRKNYFPHFTENKADSVLGEIAGYFGIDINADELPTDIAGITHTFRPGKRWVGNFLERKTNVTDYDALKGFDRYLNGAADVIFHTDDIQRLRALETELRYKYSNEGTRERLREIEDNPNLTTEQKQSLIDDIMEKNKMSHLPNLVTELRNYTDNLAGKKSISDRDWEHTLGRGFYSFMKKMENRVSANMVALNPASWLTNFIPITQVSGIVDSRNLTRAIWDATKSYAKSDGFSDRSDFLVNRRGSDMTYKTTVDKVQDRLTKPFEIIDNFTADVVTRALYYDQMAKVQNEAEALEYANDMAARIMADRSKGAQPTIFNKQSPVAKLFTMFQVEVNNQFSYMFKDVPAEIRKDGLGKLAAAFFKMFLGAFLYNEVYEKIVGRRAAFDPVDIMLAAAGNFKEAQDGKMTYVNAAGKTAVDIAQEIPFFGNLVGGGRVPMSSAMPDVIEVAKNVIGLKAGEIDSKKAMQQLGKELIKPAAYLIPPVGGGQAKKTIEGLWTMAKGEDYTYDSDGNKRLKYAIDKSDPVKTAGKYVQAAIFGKSALPEAQEYYGNSYATLSAKQTQNYYKAVEAGITYKQYMTALGATKGLESDKDKDGNTIALSLERKKKAAIDKAVEDYGLTKTQKEILYEANGVSESVW